MCQVRVILLANELNNPGVVGTAQDPGVVGTAQGLNAYKQKQAPNALHTRCAGHK